MNIFYAVILGIIQGITEFLPISSTAHLTIFATLLRITDYSQPEDWTAFMAIMQMGTVTAVILYFFKDYLKIVKGVLSDLKKGCVFNKKICSTETRLAGKIIIGSVPIAIIGLSFKDFIEGTFTKEITTIATSLIGLALLLFWAEKVGKHIRNEEQTTWLDAFVVGFAQAIALIPGSSRSGTTITAGLFLGLNRETAARFSFHLSIPAILASGIFELYNSRFHLGDLGITPLIISTIVSGIVGYYAISFLLKFLHKHTTYVFIIYRIILGLTLWILFFLKII